MSVIEIVGNILMLCVFAWLIGSAVGRLARVVYKRLR